MFQPNFKMRTYKDNDVRRCLQSSRSPRLYIKVDEEEWSPPYEGRKKAGMHVNAWGAVVSKSCNTIRLFGGLTGKSNHFQYTALAAQTLVDAS